MDTATNMFPHKRYLHLPGVPSLATFGLTRCDTTSPKYAAGRRPSADLSGSMPKYLRPHRASRPFWTLTNIFGAASPRLFSFARFFRPFLGL